MNIALCDDDAAELKTIHGIIDNWAMKNGVVIHVYEFCRGEVLRNTLLDDKKYDAFVLDVMMPEMDGITLARMLMYGKEASNRKQEIDRQHYTIPNQRPKDKHCGKI